MPLPEKRQSGVDYYPCCLFKCLVQGMVVFFLVLENKGGREEMGGYFF
jgi:hypothetical protein